jgi:hypothetical protein
MLDLMGETKDTLTLTTLKHWSAEAIDFLKAMSFSSLDELSDVSVKQPCPEFLLNPLIARVHGLLECPENTAASFSHGESCHKD